MVVSFILTVDSVSANSTRRQVYNKKKSVNKDGTVVQTGDSLSHVLTLKNKELL
jgi:hypothetical protein